MPNFTPNGGAYVPVRQIEEADPVRGGSPFETNGDIRSPANAALQRVVDNLENLRLRLVTLEGMPAPDVTVPPASLTVPGIVELATGTETIAGTLANRAVTPDGLSELTATTSRRGLVELATTAETTAGAKADVAVTPAGLRTYKPTAETATLLGNLDVSEIMRYGNFYIGRFRLPIGAGRVTVTFPSDVSMIIYKGVGSSKTNASMAIGNTITLTAATTNDQTHFSRGFIAFRI